MSRVKEAVDHGVQLAKAAGIRRVTARLEDINTPCVWVAVEEVDHQLDSLDVSLAFFLLPGGADEYRALGPAGTMLDQLLDAGLSPNGPTRTAQVRATETTAPLAALRVGTTFTVTKE